MSSEKRTRSIGRKQQVVPGHVTKIVYRQGEGPVAKAGATITISYLSYLIDGTCIKQQKRPCKITIGQGRFIEGLEVVFKTAKRYQIFTVIISPQYAYKNLEVGQAQRHIKNQTLVFQIQIFKIQYFELHKKQEIDICMHLINKISEANKLSQMQRFNDSLCSLDELLEQIKKMEYQNKQFLNLITFRKMIILQQNKKYDLLTQMISNFSSEQKKNRAFLLLSFRVYRKLGDHENANFYITKYYELERGSPQASKIYKKYLAQIGDTYRLQQIKQQHRKNNRSLLYLEKGKS